MQNVIELNNLYKLLEKKNIKKILLVCGKSYEKLYIKNTIEAFNIDIIKFNDYKPNPEYDSIKKGINLFKNMRCDCILAIGGGSSIDVAKCIKHYSANNKKDPILIAIPTTAGTGSEANRFAVYYKDYEKQSLADESIIPNYIVFEPQLLESLPIYQKKCTVMDALCQAIESYWSINSNEESKTYSKKTIEIIMQNLYEYLDNNADTYEKILEASYWSGRAINITQTTAPHAMSYKITTLLNIPHGHAVSICMPYVWEYMYDNLNLLGSDTDKKSLESIFNEIALLLGSRSIRNAIDIMYGLNKQMELFIPKISDTQLKIMINSVNQERLKNNPMYLDKEAISIIYSSIFGSTI